VSSYEKKIGKIQEQISKLEDLIVSEKPWVLRGEISGKYRPKDSLLDVALDFEQGSKVS
jgi:U3 small nucleolar ribonucleoprotein component